MLLRHPDVDGFAGRWLVACEDAGGGLVLANVRVLTVTVDPVPTTINLGASIGFGGSLTSLPSRRGSVTHRAARGSPIERRVVSAD